MLAQSAIGALTFLRTVPNMVACVACLATYLGVHRSAALKTVRELILAGRILCTYAKCVMCEQRTPVIRLRRRPSHLDSQMEARRAALGTGERIRG